jgi:hypothetical protein
MTDDELVDLIAKLVGNTRSDYCGPAAVLRAIRPHIERQALERAAASWEAEAAALPLGHEDRTRGASSYNWCRLFISKLRALMPEVPS